MATITERFLRLFGIKEIEELDNIIRFFIGKKQDYSLFIYSLDTTPIESKFTIHSVYPEIGNEAIFRGLIDLVEIAKSKVTEEVWSHGKELIMWKDWELNIECKGTDGKSSNTILTLIPKNKTIENKELIFGFIHYAK